MQNAPKRPEVGQLVNVRGVQATIVKVLPAYTIQVEAADGRSWTISGLYWAD